MNLSNSCGDYAQDRVALKVAECLEFDEAEGCSTQDGENQFPDRIKLIEKFQGVGTTFISNHTNIK